MYKNTCLKIETTAERISTQVLKHHMLLQPTSFRPGYLAPFKESTYHIPEFRHRSGPPQGKYEVFNFLHSSLHNVIERTFGVLKQKWHILKGMTSFSPRTQKHIITACLALHNFIRDSNLRDKEFERCDADEDYLVQHTGGTKQTQGYGSEDVERTRIP